MTTRPLLAALLLGALLVSALTFARFLFDNWKTRKRAQFEATRHAIRTKHTNKTQV